MRIIATSPDAAARRSGVVPSPRLWVLVLLCRRSSGDFSFWFTSAPCVEQHLHEIRDAQLARRPADTAARA